MSDLPIESPVLAEILRVNAGYAATFGEKAGLNRSPRMKLAILTCMDSRMDPAKFCGLEEGDAHVVRNAGGRASDDAIRSLVISSHIMGTTEWMVIHHTRCGMQASDDDQIRRSLGLQQTASNQKSMWHSLFGGAREPADLEWLTFKDLEQSVIDDVTRIRAHPLVPPHVTIYGFIYQIEHGTLVPVVQASEIGRRTVALPTNGTP